ncbi:inhibitor of growth protein 1 isoform X1 [Stomoxys calcitrans]|uniref:inhibitor of growth protein 1 isoform X1 n=1 Tax=Stomoxys calcitrans TaxID=35570 RepID=UPI0027E2240E|nr:inhibitor of growth protein 1 isoform X1 [Stomoxys calcitrans]
MDEMLYSATYVDNYIDSVENLPDDVQRHLSRIRDIDVQYRNLLRDVDHYYDLWRSLQNCGESNTTRRARSVTRMQQSLIQAQELGDEKMQIVTQLQELIDHKTRQLDTDQKNLDIKEEKDDIMQMQLDECGAPTPQKQTRTQSPSRVGDMSVLTGAIPNGRCFVGGYGMSNVSVINSAGGGNSTPNSERSGSGTIGSTGNNSNGTNTGLINSSNLENQRANSKRSRRRNDTVGNMELGGNESNSANEGGSNGNERNIAQKSSNLAVSQKKNAVQSLTGTTVVTAAVVGTGSGSGNSGGGVGGGGGGGGASSSSGNNHSGKKKKRKARGGAQTSAQANAREETPPPDPIDPDEPTYCVCNQISFGEMILCDNDLCPIEWFHFSCVSLVLKPKGKWYCPNCRGDRSNLMKPKAQFLKELERYNKEKEEKT